MSTKKPRPDRFSSGPEDLAFGVDPSAPVGVPKRKEAPKDTAPKDGKKKG